VYTYAVVGNSSAGLVLNPGDGSQYITFVGNALVPHAGDTISIGNNGGDFFSNVYSGYLTPVSGFGTTTEISNQQLVAMWGSIPLTGGTFQGINIASYSWSSGTCTITLAAPLVNGTNNNSIVCTLQASGVPTDRIWTVEAVLASPSVITVNVYYSLIATPAIVSAALPFYFQVVGAG
jgi:hypothetical protein